jgi:hypothetical protein
MGCVSGPFHAYSVVLMLGCYSWYGWLAKGGGMYRGAGSRQAGGERW